MLLTAIFGLASISFISLCHKRKYYLSLICLIGKIREEIITLSTVHLLTWKSVMFLTLGVDKWIFLTFFIWLWIKHDARKFYQRWLRKKKANCICKINFLKILAVVTSHSLKKCYLFYDLIIITFFIWRYGLKVIITYSISHTLLI